MTSSLSPIQSSHPAIKGLISLGETPRNHDYHSLARLAVDLFTEGDSHQTQPTGTIKSLFGPTIIQEISKGRIFRDAPNWLNHKTKDILELHAALDGAHIPFELLDRLGAHQPKAVQLKTLRLLTHYPRDEVLTLLAHLIERYDSDQPDPEIALKVLDYVYQMLGFQGLIDLMGSPLKVPYVEYRMIEYMSQVKPKDHQDAEKFLYRVAIDPTRDFLFVTLAINSLLKIATQQDSQLALVVLIKVYDYYSQRPCDNAFSAKLMILRVFSTFSPKSSISLVTLVTFLSKIHSKEKKPRSKQFTAYNQVQTLQDTAQLGLHHLKVFPDDLDWILSRLKSDMDNTTKAHFIRALFEVRELDPFESATLIERYISYGIISLEQVLDVLQETPLINSSVFLVRHFNKSVDNSGALKKLIIYSLTTQDPRLTPQHLQNAKEAIQSLSQNANPSELSAIAKKYWDEIVTPHSLSSQVIAALFDRLKSNFSKEALWYPQTHDNYNQLCDSLEIMYALDQEKTRQFVRKLSKSWFMKKRVKTLVIEHMALLEDKEKGPKQQITTPNTSYDDQLQYLDKLVRSRIESDRLQASIHQLSVSLPDSKKSDNVLTSLYRLSLGTDIYGLLGQNSATAYLLRHAMSQNEFNRSTPSKTTLKSVPLPEPGFETLYERSPELYAMAVSTYNNPAIDTPTPELALFGGFHHLLEKGMGLEVLDTQAKILEHPSTLSGIKGPALLYDTWEPNASRLTTPFPSEITWKVQDSFGTEGTVHWSDFQMEDLVVETAGTHSMRSLSKNAATQAMMVGAQLLQSKGPLAQVRLPLGL